LATTKLLESNPARTPSNEACWISTSHRAAILFNEINYLAIISEADGFVKKKEEIRKECQVTT